MIQSFRTDRPGQTMQTQIKGGSLIRAYTVCNSLCIFWMQYSKVKPSYSTFRVITENVLDVWYFRNFKVIQACWNFTIITTTSFFGSFTVHVYSWDAVIFLLLFAFSFEIWNHIIPAPFWSKITNKENCCQPITVLITLLPHEQQPFTAAYQLLL